MDELINILLQHYNKEDIIIKNKKTVKILSHEYENRNNLIDNLLKILPNSYHDINYKYSSVGCIVYNNINILIKPKNKQGKLSAGLHNEHYLVDNINKYITGSINLTFSSSYNINYNNITTIKTVGFSTSNYSKSDISLYSSSINVGNISLKKHNAGIWESADRRYKNLLLKLCDNIFNKKYPNIQFISTHKNNIYKLYNPILKIPISGIIIKNIPNQDNNSIIFGNDNPSPIIIKHTFQSSDFTYFHPNLTININKIFKNLSDIENTEYEPCLLIRHDSIYYHTYGLRCIVTYKNKVYKNNKPRGKNIELDWKDI